MRHTGTLWTAILLGVLVAACSSSPPAVETQPGQGTIALPPATTEAPLPSNPPTSTASPAPPSATPTEQPPSPASQTPTQAALPTNTLPAATVEPLCDMAGFVNDVTIPDKTEVEAGSTFTKTWRLRNDGTCSWNSGYRIIFSEGDELEGPSSAELTSEDIAPGETLDISLDLTAPEDPGEYIGYWLLQNADGDAFGIGASAAAFWVQITVPE